MQICYNYSAILILGKESDYNSRPAASLLLHVTNSMRFLLPSKSIIRLYPAHSFSFRLHSRPNSVAAYPHRLPIGPYANTCLDPKQRPRNANV